MSALTRSTRAVHQHDCGIGLLGGQRPSLASHVTLTEPKEGQQPPKVVHVPYPQERWGAAADSEHWMLSTNISFCTPRCGRVHAKGPAGLGAPLDERFLRRSQAEEGTSPRKGD